MMMSAPRRAAVADRRSVRPRVRRPDAFGHEWEPDLLTVGWGCPATALMRKRRTTDTYGCDAVPSKASRPSRGASAPPRQLGALPLTHVGPSGDDPSQVNRSAANRGLSLKGARYVSSQTSSQNSEGDTGAG